MSVVYTKTGVEVKLGDVVQLDGVDHLVTYFTEPHKPSSSGKVWIRWGEQTGLGHEYYVNVIGAEWIEREDQPWRYPQQLELDFVYNIN